MPDEPSEDERDGAVGGDADDPGPSTGLPPRLERWRRRSATGAIMTGFAFGLQQVFEPEHKGPSIVQESSGDPPEDLAVDADVDPLAARRTVVRIRPWLFERTGGTEEPAGPADPPDPGRGPA